MVQFIALLQAAQNGDRALDARLVDDDFLEAALQSGILFDVLAVLVQRGRADTVQFAARQRRLEHIAGVDRAFGLASPDHGMNLVDENDRLALVLRQLLEHTLEPLFEFTPVLGARQQRSHIEHQHTLALQRLRDLFIDNALGEAFHNGGFTNTGLPDQHRVVLGTPLQDLDAAPDLIVAANNGIELALLGALGEIKGEFLQCFTLPFGFGAIDALPATHSRDRLFERGEFGTVFTEQLAGVALVLCQGEQEQLGRDELVTAFLRHLVGHIEQIAKIARHVNVATVPLNLGQSANRRAQGFPQRFDAHAGARQEGHGEPVL